MQQEDSLAAACEPIHSFSTQLLILKLSWRLDSTLSPLILPVHWRANHPCVSPSWQHTDSHRYFSILFHQSSTGNGWPTATEQPSLQTAAVLKLAAGAYSISKI